MVEMSDFNTSEYEDVVFEEIGHGEISKSYRFDTDLFAVSKALIQTKKSQINQFVKREILDDIRKMVESEK